eukprot:CAMPEP_0115882830 /NCGR_PEP_ID=MMETSP0287-20121206/29218_1 /TAXON_ID=412157 /ORGANISM="Chrysochromulina rotalis, Strain UIO044" /LENGTH=38 /DNA_ID= /DNA_START= /DNA_END= /DNA_ORIENTATION=
MQAPSMCMHAATSMQAPSICMHAATSMQLAVDLKCERS